MPEYIIVFIKKDLREKGYKDLPKSVTILLKSNKYAKIKIKRMEVKSRRKRHKGGHYVYFGIAENLRWIISLTVYAKRVIKLLVNIDGLPIFNRSSQQFWLWSRLWICFIHSCRILREVEIKFCSRFLERFYQRNQATS